MVVRFLGPCRSLLQVSLLFFDSFLFHSVTHVRKEEKANIAILSICLASQKYLFSLNFSFQLLFSSGCKDKNECILVTFSPRKCPFIPAAPFQKYHLVKGIAVIVLPSIAAREHSCSHSEITDVLNAGDTVLLTLHPLPDYIRQNCLSIPAC